MKAEETRLRLMKELQAQFSKTEATFDVLSTNTIDKPALYPSQVDNRSTFFGDASINDCKISADKPKMFMPKDLGRLEIVTESITTPIKGIGFTNTTTESTTIKTIMNQEIYSMKELISTNQENMRTISYDENVVKAQLALVKKKEWQDILFEDIDWFKKIDLTSGIKKLFRIS